MPDPDRSRPDPAPRTRPGLRLRSAVVALLTLTAAGSAAAQSEPSSADKLVDRRLARQIQLGLQDVAAWEADAILTPRPGGLSVGTTFQGATVDLILRELGPVLDDDYKKLKPRLSKLAEDAKVRRDEAQKDWAEVV